VNDERSLRGELLAAVDLGAVKIEQSLPIEPEYLDNAVLWVTIGE
jgi:hypothetical protein